MPNRQASQESAQVQIQDGSRRFVPLLSRGATDELGLQPGMLAVAAIKATSVPAGIPASGSSRS
jgi:molybdopterin-binding protein